MFVEVLVFIHKNSHYLLKSCRILEKRLAKDAFIMKILQLILMTVFLGFSWAQTGGSGRFVVAYEDSSSEFHLELAAMFQTNGFFEATAAGLNEVIALPLDIGIVAGQCDTVNAFWTSDFNAIVMCYELIEYLYEIFRPETKSQQELDNAVLGAIEFIFYHELGHALIHIFDIPFTGKEEDAVDQFSTIVLLGTDAGVESALSGASFFFISGQADSEGLTAKDLAFWGEHSLDQQRFYNIVCLIYGSDPETYTNLIRQESKGFLLTKATGYLPKERADRCPSEYKAISKSWDTLLNAYVAFKDSSQEVAVSPEPTPTPATIYNHSFSGSLQVGDKVYKTEELFDEFVVSLSAGQEAIFELNALDFEPYLLVRTPDGAVYWNDYYPVDVGYGARLVLPISVSGDWIVEASSYAVGETGPYHLGISTTDNVYQSLVSDTITTETTAFTETGEFYHIYDYEFTKGERVVIALTSTEFDTFLYAKTPSGEYFVNDDYENQSSLSRIDFVAPEDGNYEVYVTTHDVGEVGYYEMVIGRQEAVVAEPQASASTEGTSFNITDMTSSKARSTNLGVLEAGDELLDSGEYVDFYSMDLSEGQEVKFTLVSADFNTYMAVMSPSGEFFEEDELPADDSRFQFALNVTEAGIWYIFVTTQNPGESGNYLLSVKK